MSASLEPTFARDMDLVREILLWAEKGGWMVDQPKTDSVKLAYHARIMIDGGLVEGTAELRRIRGPIHGWHPGIVEISGLTWKGHEFLEAMRSETTWTKTKETFSRHGVPFITDILLSVAKSVIAQRTGLPIS